VVLDWQPSLVGATKRDLLPYHRFEILKTFFLRKTAPQYTCEYFTTSQLDFQRWDAVFTNRIAYSKNVHEDVKEWVANNIVRWKEEKPDFFYIEKIPDVSPQDRKESEENYC